MKVRLAIIGSVAATGVLCAWADPTPPTPPQATSNRAEAIHVLNRITYGPRPGDVERVEKMGVQKYIQEQLHPEAIDDSAVEEQVKQFPLLQLSSADLSHLYYDRKTIKQVKKRTSAQENLAKADGANKEEIEAKLQAYQKRVDEKLDRHDSRELLETYGDAGAIVSELQHAKLIRAANSNRQLQEVLVDFWGNHFNIDVKKKVCAIYKPADDRDVIRANIFGSFRDMLGASAKSPAMLYYLDNAKNTAPMVAEEPTTKKNRKKKTAETPEATSSEGQDNTMMAQGKTPPPTGKVKKERGINENYAREIMELHTLGVDGGYTQKDVQEVARCFTGWTIDQNTGTFAFKPFLHDNGEKVVLGHKIPANGGQKDGEMVLDILAANPATAKFISRKMCQRFVADNPPPALVDRVASVFTKTHGDLRKVTEAILTSPEFLDPASYRNKIKSPEEFAVSAVRASGITLTERELSRKERRTAVTTELESQAVKNGGGKAAERIAQFRAQPLSWHIFELGQPLFACTPPTGYKEVSSTWVSPGALIERLNFAMALTGQKVPEAQFTAKTILNGADLDDPQDVLHQCVASLLQGQVSDQTLKVLNQAAVPEKGSGSVVDPNKLIALIIGSPEFQRK